MSLLKYVKAQQNILNYIAKSNLAAGGKLPTEREFSKLLGISVITLRRALLEFENNGIIERRQGSGTYLNRKLNNAPKQGSIGYLFVPSNKDNIKSPEIFALNEEVQKRGHLLKYITAFDVPDKNVLHELSRTKGILVSGKLKKEIIDVLIALGLPLVAIGSIPPECRVCLVAQDWKMSSKLLTEYFLKKNIKKIGLVNSATHYLPSHEIYSGFRDAFEEAGMTFDEKNILWVRPGKRYEDISDFLKKRKIEAFVIESGNLREFMFCAWELDIKPGPYIGIMSSEQSRENRPGRIIEMSFKENIIVKAVEILFDAMNEKKFKEERILIAPTLT